VEPAAEPWDQAAAAVLAGCVRLLEVFWKKDKKAAWEKYMAYTKQGGSRTFTELLENAGLDTPFDEKCLREVCETASAWLDGFDLTGIA
jgi:oligoendopeptidase F